MKLFNIVNKCDATGGGGGGGGGTLIFSYIRRLESFLGGQNFEFQDFLGFQKMNDIFGGVTQNWTIFRVHFYAF